MSNLSAINGNKLYRAFSFVDNHQGLSNVYFTWFYHQRQKPLALYDELIEGYVELNKKEKAHAQRYVDELFIDEEVEAFCELLHDVYEIESFIVEKPLPVSLDDMDESKIDIEVHTYGGIYMLSEEKGYNLPFKVWGYYGLIKNKEIEKRDSPVLLSSDKIPWLARQIFTEFPKQVTGLKFYILDCGCIYYHRVFRDGELDTQVAIYRDADYGPCEVCLLQEDNWTDRVIDETVIYSSQFQIEPSNSEP